MASSDIWWVMIFTSLITIWIPYNVQMCTNCVSFSIGLGLNVHIIIPLNLALIQGFVQPSNKRNFVKFINLLLAMDAFCL
jgi:hypothetical protein